MPKTAGFVNIYSIDNAEKIPWAFDYTICTGPEQRFLHSFSFFLAGEKTDGNNL